MSTLSTAPPHRDGDHEHHRDHAPEHDHGQGHGQGHGHGHAAAADPGRAFAIGVGLNVAFVALEVFYGLQAHSLALLSDAGHNLGDVLGLSLALGAALLARTKPSRRRTYGLRKATVLAALANAIILVAATGAIVWQAVLRLMHPSAPAGLTMVAIAGIGVLVNGGSALLFLRDRHRDLNVGSAFLHLAGDAAIALGVVAAGAVIAKTGWVSVDPIVSLVVSALVLVSSWRLLRTGVGLVVDAVPDAVDVDAVRAMLAEPEGVTEVHDLHVWALSTTEVAMTAHLVMRATPTDNDLLHDLSRRLHDTFGIAHATIQIECCEDPRTCHLAPDDHV